MHDAAAKDGKLNVFFGGRIAGDITNMSDPEHHTEKSYAALAYALGVARGMLGDVVDGKFECGDVRRFYEATAAFWIAESIGVKDSDVSVDWDDHLSKTEKLKIQGYQSAEPSRQ